MGVTGRLGLGCSRLAAFALASINSYTYFADVEAGATALTTAMVKMMARDFSASAAPGNATGSSRLARFMAARALLARINDYFPFGRFPLASFSGSLTKQTSRTFAASSAALAGAMALAYLKISTYTGWLGTKCSRLGAFQLESKKSCPTFLSEAFAAIHSSGADTVRTSKALTATLPPKGQFTRSFTLAAAVQALAGTLAAAYHKASTYTGRLGTMCSRLAAFQLETSKSCTTAVIITATLPSSTTLAKTAVKPLVATGALAAAMAKQTARRQSATLPLSPAMSKMSPRSFAATLPLAPSLLKRANKAMAASLTFASASLRTVAKALAASLAASGLLIRFVPRALAAALQPSGALAKSTGVPLAASAPAAGSLSRRAGKALSAILRTSAAVSNGQLFLVALTASLASAGSATRRAGKSLASLLGLAGSVTRAGSAALPWRAEPRTATWAAVAASRWEQDRRPAEWAAETRETTWQRT